MEVAQGGQLQPEPSVKGQGGKHVVKKADSGGDIYRGYDSCLTVEFMRAFSVNGGITLHQKCEYGDNAHHITEALFKSLGVALKEAVRVEGDAVVSMWSKKPIPVEIFTSPPSRHKLRVISVSFVVR